jgi:hypothetical protein
MIWEYHTLDEVMAEAKIDLRAQQESGGNLDPDLMVILNLGNLTFASPTGPMWYRGYAQDSEANLGEKLNQVLSKYKAKYMVLGHTIPATKRITPRFEGKVLLIDTGMLARSFQGRPSALEIAGGQFKTIYVGEPARPINANGK